MSKEPLQATSAGHSPAPLRCQTIRTAVSQQQAASDQAAGSRQHQTTNLLPAASRQGFGSTSSAAQRLTRRLHFAMSSSSVSLMTLSASWLRRWRGTRYLQGAGSGQGRVRAGEERHATQFEASRGFGVLQDSSHGAQASSRRGGSQQPPAQLIQQPRPAGPEQAMLQPSTTAGASRLPAHLRGAMFQ